ncbi:hypothetical protein SAMN05428989_3448 [Pseudoxanthomonas sp. GM95]|nr:hypothetical protein SAMN05428989_3448 [Pseudoxanthomonas sp. GM95]
MGSDLRGELALLQRLQAVAQTPGLSLSLCHDFADCDLLVVRDDASLRSAAQRIVANHPWLPMWSLHADGRLSDALAEPQAPLDDHHIRTVLQRLHVIARSHAPSSANAAESTVHEPLGLALRKRLASADTVAALTLDGRDLLLLDFRRLLAITPPGATGPDDTPAQVLGREFARLSLRTLPPARYSTLFVDLPSLPMIPLLWQAALRMAVVPELLPPLHEGCQLKLARWPDFRVLAHRHDDFRLCSLLLRRACTVLEASHALGVDPGAVRAFFNAAWLSGYAQVEAESAVAPPPPPTRQRGPGALLASMWRGVRRARGGSA